MLSFDDRYCWRLAKESENFSAGTAAGASMRFATIKQFAFTGTGGSFIGSLIMSLNRGGLRHQGLSLTTSRNGPKDADRKETRLNNAAVSQ
jgi:hypothetical protein